MQQVQLGPNGNLGVRFKELPEVLLLSRSPPQQEINMMWYTATDLQAVREDSRATLKALKKAASNATALDEDEHCLRGLEGLQKHGSAREKKSRTRSLIQGVLDEQFHQRQMGITDPKGLQVLSSACSKQARERALFAAKNDEREVKEMFFDNLEESSWSSQLSSQDSGSLMWSEKNAELGGEDQKLADSVRPKINIKARSKNSSYARSA